jgi:endonuclease/exonuclease/phosphatase (EEP) superfamily protein YafD
MAEITAVEPSSTARFQLSWLAVRVVIVWLLTGFIAVWALVRVFGLERGVLAVQLMAFTPYVALAAVVPVAASVLTGRWVAAGVAAVAAVTLAVCVVPRAFGSPSTVVGQPVRVMSVNMRLGGADAAAIVDLVRSRAVDVLTVQEYTEEARANLAGAGIDDLLPHQELSPQPGASGSGVYSRFPISGTGLSVNPGYGFHQVTATISIPGATPVEVHSVHPDPPGPGTEWAAGLQAQTPAGPGTPQRILAGDFNATLDHGELRRILDTGYRDAAAEVGAGLTPTWPYYGRRTSVTPKVTIDHVLVNGGIGVRDFAAVTIPRTDHRAIIATLVVP